MVDVGWLMVDWMLVGCRLMGWLVGLVVASIVAAIGAHLAQGDEGNRLKFDGIRA